MAGRARKTWREYSPAYRARLSRHGINESNYRDASRQAARGHAKTPERPSLARKHPERFPEYVRKHEPKPPQGGPTLSLAEQVIRRKEQLFGDYIKFNRTRSARVVRQNPVTHAPPDAKKMRRFLQMQADQLKVNWRNDEWAFLFYH